MPKVAVYSIAKNEAKHADRWAASTDAADVRVVLDTGSTDETVQLLRAQGVYVYPAAFRDEHSPVVFGQLDLPGTFRFDVARNAALECVPVDVDICISLDLDETLDPGFIDAVKAAWTPGVTKLRPWINTGTWWRCDRVHARRGYKWVGACHEISEWVGDGVHQIEIQREVEAQIRHEPDNLKPRDYVPLLEVAVAEEPENSRMWFYLCRQYHYGADHDNTVKAAMRLAEIGTGWVVELAGAYRLAAQAKMGVGDDERALAWLELGTRTAPKEAEAWAALAKFHYDRQHWPELHEAAFAGAQCPMATHYMTDQAERAWGLWDKAALGAHHSGEHDVAVSCGYKAWRANPDDERLQTNLHFYVAAQAVPTFAVIPKVAGERDGMTSVLQTALIAQGVMVLVDESDEPIYRKWNRGIELAVHAATGAGDHDRWNVLILNNDIEIGDGFVDRLVAALRADDNTTIAYPADGTDAFTGWCFALRGEDAWAVDEQFEWWYGDTDIYRRATAGDGRAETVPLPVAHLHANESTLGSPERLEAARRDEARFAAKWGEDPASLFLAQHPGWGAFAALR